MGTFAPAHGLFVCLSALAPVNVDDVPFFHILDFTYEAYLLFINYIQPCIVYSSDVLDEYISF